jgi:chemotaxis protein CheZ
MESDSQLLDLAFHDVAKNRAQEVLASLDRGDVDHAVEQLLSFNDARNDGLYQQIGKMTRGLHNAIVNMEFKSDAVGDGQRDVNARLAYVIELTASAANRTMDLAEDALPIASELRDESTRLGVEWEKLGKRELTSDEFRNLYSQMADFLAYSAAQSSKMQEGFTEIVLAQGYQDLSGQIVQKIMAMLKRTEEDLVGLLALSGRMQRADGTTLDIDTVHNAVEHSYENMMSGSKLDADGKDLVAEGPLPDAAGSLQNQDEVDDLLSSLGF